jgi:hypothetical protein
MNAHLEEHLFILLVCFRVNLLCELDDRLEVGINFFLLQKKHRDQ